LGKESHVNIEGFGAGCNILGDSGVYDQVDVLTSVLDGTHTHKTAIECKYWNKKINKDTVMKLWAIIADSGIERGIIVSRNGFTRDAKKFAGHYHIELI
jgi:predicted helicase